MKKLSISAKLILGFSSVLVLLILSSVMYITCIAAVSEQTGKYDAHTIPSLKNMYQMKLDMHAASQNMLKAVVEEDKVLSNEALAEVDRYASDFAQQLESFSANEGNGGLTEKIGEIRAAAATAGDARRRITALLARNDKETDAQALEIYLKEYEPALRQMSGLLTELESAVLASADAQSDAVARILSSSWRGVVATVGLSILLTLVLTLVIRRAILAPVKEIVSVYGEISRGNLQAHLNFESKDELGRMAQSIRSTNALITSYIQDISQKLGQMAAGDMRVHMDMDYVGDFAAIRDSIEQLARSLNETLLTINATAEQVSTGASQLSGGAQALAAGSTQQASAIEQLSEAVGHVADQASANSENVRTATQYVEQAGMGVQTGNAHMEQLTRAMEEINATSSQIAGITKVIEDIAFQTNILALNAAIEAARAGSAGKGFAVVADEVRNLAAKSAAAAKQTAELIEASVATVSKGTEITAQTAQILMSIREKTQLVIDSITRIEAGSSEQAEAIEQIRQGLSQVSAVVQTNAATAEENSAISEQMSAQASALHEAVGRFRLKAV